jgi:hypothetical protein
MRTDEARPAVGVMAQPSVLELGEDIGAAVVYTAAALEGEEIEIKSRSGDWDGKHTAVRGRPCGRCSETQFVALFFGLSEGTYDLRVRDRLRDDVRSMQVSGGRVTEVTW